MTTNMAQLSKLNDVLLASDEAEYDKIATEAVSQLSKAPETDTGNLDEINPTTQTIAFLFSLSNQIDLSLKSGKAHNKQLPASILPEGRLWPAITKILLEFHPIQVRYVGHLLTKVTELVAKGAEQTTNYVPAIQLLENVILRLDPTSSTLTSTHYAYLRLCLLANAYAQAASVLDRPIYHIPSADASRQLGSRAYKYLCSPQDTSATYVSVATRLTQRINSRTYMEYFLLGAMCYMGIGHYEKALHFLEIVLTVPTNANAVSVVQLEAFKKWSLVSLLVHGRPGKVPRALAQPALRNLRAAAKPYECLMDAFKSGKIEKIQGEIQEGINIWQDDENYGLVHEVFAAFRKFAILGLAKTYAALSIEEVTRLASADPTDVEGMMTFVALLLQSGELQAEVVPRTEGNRESIIRFASEQVTAIPEMMVEREMVKRTQELQTILKTIGDIDHYMEIHKDYIEYLQRLRNARERSKKNDAAATRGIGVEMVDEDMMDDL